MKKKITYILTTAVITLTAFFIEKNTAIIQTETENNNIKMDDGIIFYTFDGNIYEWRK